VGETMAIGRTFKEALQKGLRSLEIGRFGFGADGRGRFEQGGTPPGMEEIRQKLITPNSQRIFYLRYALKAGMDLETIYALTGIDPWFLHQMALVIGTEEEIRRSGVEEIRLEETRAVRAGKFLVVCADDLLDRFGTGDVVALAPRVRLALTEIQSQFLARYPQASLDFAVYDLHPVRPGNLGRLVFPHWLPEGHVEPACGTGTIAVCAVLAFLGKLSESAASDGLEVGFESGGGPDLGGPDTTTAVMELAGGEIKSIRFSHSFVELTSRGKVMLPV